VRTSLIVGAAEGNVIGRDGDLPWYLPEDLKRFKSLTAGHVVVVGRKTHESIVARLGKPLPGRISVVVSRDERAGADTVIFERSIDAALSVARGIERFAGGDEVFVIGGAQIYIEALPEVDRVYLTRVHMSVEGDTALPEGWLKGFTLVSEEHAGTHSYLTYQR
jgi:dihydrofolate reductase